MNRIRHRSRTFYFEEKQDGESVSHLQLTIIDGDNPKHDYRPYGVIENVRTEEGYENIGYATRLLEAAISHCKYEHCYKVFLATSSRKDNVHHLYEKLGFDRDEKVCYNLYLEDDDSSYLAIKPPKEKLSRLALDFVKGQEPLNVSLIRKNHNVSDDSVIRIWINSATHTSTRVLKIEVVRDGFTQDITNDVFNYENEEDLHYYFFLDIKIMEEFYRRYPELYPGSFLEEWDREIEQKKADG